MLTLYTPIVRIWLLKNVKHLNRRHEMLNWNLTLKTATGYESRIFTGTLAQVKEEIACLSWWCEVVHFGVAE